MMTKLRRRRWTSRRTRKGREVVQVRLLSYKTLQAIMTYNKHCIHARSAYGLGIWKQDSRNSLSLLHDVKGLSWKL